MKGVIYLAGGCFWGTEKYFEIIKGVVSTEVGYANGKTEYPNYDQVCHEDTGHVETVKIVYDKEIIRLEFILELFYKIIDPTSINRQGGDTGTQYRTGIYYTDKSDIEIIKKSLEKLAENYNNEIAIEFMPIKNYYKAEEYHQKYLDKHPYGYCHIDRNKFMLAREAVDIICTGVSNYDEGYQYK